MKSAKPTSRRNFLVAAGLGTAGAVATVAAVAKRGSGKPGPAAVDGRKGYHVSDHILKYYKTTQV